MSRSSVEIHFYIDTKGQILFSILIINCVIICNSISYRSHWIQWGSDCSPDYCELVSNTHTNFNHAAFSWGELHMESFVGHNSPPDSKKEQQYNSTNLTVLQLVMQGLHRWETSEGQTWSWQLSFPPSFLSGYRYAATLERASCFQERLLTNVSAFESCYL